MNASKIFICFVKFSSFVNQVGLFWSGAHIPVMNASIQYADTC